MPRERQTLAPNSDVGTVLGDGQWKQKDLEGLDIVKVFIRRLLVRMRYKRGLSCSLLAKCSERKLAVGGWKIWNKGRGAAKS